MIKGIVLCIACVLILCLLPFFIIRKVRSRRFSPARDRGRKQSQLNQDQEDLSVESFSGPFYESAQDYEMQNAFVNALIDLGYQPHEYAVRRNAVTIHYTVLHSDQPVTHDTLPVAVIQKANRNSCMLYHQVTHGYRNTLNKLEYLKNMAPKLYAFCMHSLYARSFYKAFSWLPDLIHGDRQDASCKTRCDDICHDCQDNSCGGR